MKYAWLTDIHLDHLGFNKLINFFESIVDVDGVFISGDISIGKHLVDHLKTLSKYTQVPIYFVLGNHDYYESDFFSVKKSVYELDDNLIYLTDQNEPIQLSHDTCLIGDDGWYDAKWSKPLTNLVFIADFLRIKDFRNLKSNNERFNLVEKISYESARNVREKLLKALKKYKTVYFVTHFPPWPEEIPSIFNIGNRFWDPYCSSTIMSDMILQVMTKYKDNKLIILCGHNHSEYKISISHNILMKIGGARIRNPKINEIITI